MVLVARRAFCRPRTRTARGALPCLWQMDSACASGTGWFVIGRCIDRMADRNGNAITFSTTMMAAESPFSTTRSTLPRTTATSPSLTTPTVSSKPSRISPAVASATATMGPMTPRWTRRPAKVSPVRP